jgi:hypothetical protein
MFKGKDRELFLLDHYVGRFARLMMTREGWMVVKRRGSLHKAESLKEV